MLAVGSLEPACDELEWLDDPDDYQRTVSPAGWERQTLRLARRIPELRIPNRPLGIVGIYDVADDWIPIYDRTALPGFYVAIGTSGNQFKNAQSSVGFWPRSSAAARTVTTTTPSPCGWICPSPGSTPTSVTTAAGARSTLTPASA